MDPNIDAKNAIDNAIEFLVNYHNTTNPVSTSLENDVWLVLIDVGFLTTQIVEVKVHATSGKILGYVHVDDGHDD